ncbi:MAG: flagellar basal body L-ring protein FlgH, partial [Candidatus Accumulibacter sp.]|nr:flagellar basal body L-ring protein FlgH [Accumulibacter sp.]
MPPTNVHQPMTVRPAPRGASIAANGSIYQPGVSRTLFEDRRARYVGDTMTIVIAETTSASTQSNTSVSRSGSVNASIPTVVGLPLKS